MMYTGAGSTDEDSAEEVEILRSEADMAEQGDARRRRAYTETIYDFDEEPVVVRRLCFYHSMERKLKALLRFVRRLLILAAVVVVAVHILGLLVNFRVIRKSEKPTKDIPRGSYRFIYLSGIRAFILLLCQLGFVVGHFLRVCEMIPFFYTWVILIYFFRRRVKRVLDRTVIRWTRALLLRR